MIPERIKKLIWDVLLFPVWRLLDYLLPKEDNYWAFPVHYTKSNQLIENCRAVYEGARSVAGVRRIIFCREVRNIDLDDLNPADVFQIGTLRGMWMLARCKVIFISNSISMDYAVRWKTLFKVIKPALKRRIVVNLWHGIPFKAIHALANPPVRRRIERLPYRVAERGCYSGLICSSKIDSYAMMAAFYPMPPSKAWITGLPRNDYLVKEEKELSGYLQQQIESLRRIKQGKRLIVYAPTYRQAVVNDAMNYQFSADEIEALRVFLREHNTILGFRMHYFRNRDNLFNMEQFADNRDIFNLSHENFPEIAPVIRQSDMLITDYSSVYIDALFVNKPVFSFAYDLEKYKQEQDGLLYDFDIVFPGPVTTDFRSLLNALKEEISSPTQVKTERYRLARQFFFEYFDAHNTDRVIERVRQALST